MERKIFVNLAVKDLKRSMSFFTKLGFSFNPQFTDENAACMIIGKDSFVMLLKESFFKTFTKKTLADASKNTEVLVALSAESKQKVNELFYNALANGASEARETQDMEVMYSRSFNDPDGHTWEIIWMNMKAMNQQKNKEPEENMAE